MNKGKHRWLKFSLIGIAIVLLGCVSLVFIGLSCAKMEMTAGGVYTRLRIPLPFVHGAIAFPTLGRAGEHVFVKGYLAGPVVRRQPGGRWTASWFCQDRVQHARGTGAVVSLTCAGQHHTYQLTNASIPPAVAPMPDQLVVLSDLEGNRAFLDAALRKLGVTGGDGHWNYGTGQLVILGDSVDRGREVLAVLWRLHDLAIEAQAAGGAVRVVLGNHEQYMLRGVIKSAHPEFRYALQQLGGYQKSLAADTVLGAWLRQQPVALKLGQVLFVHGGVSPQTAKASLTIQQLNQAMRDYWPHTNQQVTHTAALDAVLGATGVTQYRGYFRNDRKDLYAKATPEQVTSVLKHFDARQVVVAHTLVEKIQHLYNGRVIAVDVNYNKAAPEVLVFEHGKPHVLDMGLHRGISTDPKRQLREFSLFDSKDRAILAGIIHGILHGNDIPWPY